jgi:hypothetical protein
MRVFLEEVVFHLPCVVKAQPVGQLDLFKSLVKKVALVALVPGSRQLEFMENSEAHFPPFAKIFLSSGQFDVEDRAATAARCRCRFAGLISNEIAWPSAISANS